VTLGCRHREHFTLDRDFRTDRRASLDRGAANWCAGEHVSDALGDAARATALERRNVAHSAKSIVAARDIAR